MNFTATHLAETITYQGNIIYFLKVIKHTFWFGSHSHTYTRDLKGNFFSMNGVIRGLFLCSKIVALYTFFDIKSVFTPKITNDTCASLISFFWSFLAKLFFIGMKLYSRFIHNVALTFSFSLIMFYRFSHLTIEMRKYFWITS